MNVPTPTYQTITVKTNASVNDTLKWIQQLAETNAGDVRELALSLKGTNDYETCNNVWTWVKGNIKYNYDREGVEQIRTPRRTYHERVADCDCMTLFISALLYNLSIPHSYRVVAWKGKGNWAHIYPVAHVNNRDVALDCIPESKYFDAEIKHSDKMDLQVLAGFDEINEIEEPSSTMGDALVVTNELEGFEGDGDGEEQYPISLNGMVEAAESETNANYLSGTEIAKLNDADALASLKDAYKAMKEPTLSGVHDDDDHNGLHGLITEWCDLSRAEKTQKLQALSNGLARFTLDYESKKVNGCEAKHNLKEFYTALAGQVMYGEHLEELGESLPFVINGSDDLTEMKGYLDTLEGSEREYASEVLKELDKGSMNLLGLGKKKTFKKAPAKKKGLKKLASKVRTGLNKVKAKVLKYSPATVLVRNGILLSMKTNLFKLGSRLSYGYLAPEQARAMGLDAGEHQKLVSTLKNLENTFIKLGGNKSNLEKAIKGSKKAKNVIAQAPKHYVADKSGGLAFNEGKKGTKVQPRDIEPQDRAGYENLLRKGDKIPLTAEEESFKQYLINKYGEKGLNPLKGLGAAPAAAAPIAAATPVLAKLAAMLKTVNFKKLFAKATTKPPEEEITDDSSSNLRMAADPTAQTNSNSINTEMAETTDVGTPSADAGLSASKTAIADPTTDTATKSWLARTWADPKKKWLLIGGSLGLVLVIIFVIWLIARKKKKSPLSGKRKKRTASPQTHRIQIRRVARNPQSKPIIQYRQLSGPPKKKSTTKRKPAKKKKSRRI